MTAADHANTVREKVPHYVEGNLVIGATDVHSENCPGCAIEPALDALQAQAETAEEERAKMHERVMAMHKACDKAEAETRSMVDEARRATEAMEAAEAERDAAVQAAEQARNALQKIERMAGAAGAGETPAQPIAAIARGNKP